jgi:hypothetical protein
VPCQYLYPGATYTWTSTDPNFSAPTNNESNLSFTATAAFSYTLSITVTNPQGGFETITDIINISIAPAPTVEIQLTNPGPAGTWCEFNHEIYFVNGNPIGLTGTGLGINGTYDWFYSGVLIASNTPSLTVPWGLLTIGEYEIELVGTENGCSSSAFITVHIVNNKCQLPCNTVLGESAFQDPNNNNVLTNYTSGPHDYVNTSAANFSSLPVTGPNLTYVVDGTFTINSGASVTFTDVTILISPGGKIINNGQLNLDHCVVDACEQMWDRIDNFGSLTVNNNSNINHAEAAIELRANSYTKISGSTFTNNIVSVFSRSIVNSNNTKTLNYFSVVGTTFQGVGNIPATMRFTSQYSQYTGLSTGNTPLQQPAFFERPANGINIRAVAAINIGNSANNTLPNQFINMWNGISLNATTSTIENCRFIGMEANANHGQWNITGHPLINNSNPNFGSHYINIHSNALAILGGSNVRFNSLLNDDANNSTIQNCFRGIQCLGSSLTTVFTSTPSLNGDMMFIRDVNTGLRCESNTQIHQLNVQQLDIEACNLGIVVNNQQAGSVSNVRYNNILMAALPGFSPSGMRAIQHRQIANDGTNGAGTDLNLVVNAASPQIFFNVNNNVISTQLSQWAIEIWGGTRTRIFDNFISMAFNTTNFWGNGIELVNCFGSAANCNYITTTGATPSQQGGSNLISSAIKLRSSENISLSCNETERFWDGLSVNYPSIGGIFRGNTFRNEQSGLHYLTFANVGDQLNHGNRWQNPFNNTIGAARADMPNFVDYFDDRYFVEAGVTTPPSVVTSAIGAAWFVASVDPPFNCQDAGFVCNWVNPDRENDTTQYEARLVGKATEQNDSTDFGDEKLWMSKNYLIKELIKNESITYGNSTLTDFIDSARNTGAYKLQIITKKMNHSQLGDSALNIQVNIANELYNLKIDEYYQALSNNDSLLASSLSFQVGEAFTERELILNQINANKITEKSVLEAELNALSTSNAIEANLKNMLLIYLNSCFISNFDNLSNQEATLTNMAYQCPMEFGDAVYWARTMLSMVHENLEFNDDAVCQEETNQRRAKKESIRINALSNKNTLVYPNPTNNQFFVLPKSESCQSISIRNQFGSIVWSNNQVLKFPFEINVDNLPSGMYILEIVFEHNKIENHKLTIFH